MNRTKARRLIINADDFGLSPAINRAIQCTASEGVVTSTTVMANMPHAEQVVDFASVCPEVSIGLHINLISGRPVLPGQSVPSLVDHGGHFVGWRGFVRRLWTGRVRREDMEAEVMAQITKLEQMVGNITHIDSHKHIHVFPWVLQVLLRAASGRGITRMRTNRRYFPSSLEHDRSQWRMVLQHLCHNPLAFPGLVLKSIQRNLVQRYGFSTPDCLLSPLPAIPTLCRESAVCAWSRVLRRIPVGTVEVNCHPGGVPGEEELFTAPGLRLAIQQLDIELVSYLQV